MGDSLLSDSQDFDPRLKVHFSILDNRFSILDENRVENQDSQQTVNLLLNGTVRETPCMLSTLKQQAHAMTLITPPRLPLTL